MNRVAHFEIHAADPERAAKFYRALFGWDIKEWTMPGVEVKAENRYWLVNAGAGQGRGVDGGILVRRGPPPVDGQAVNAYVCTIEVESVDDFVARALANGAGVAVPKMPIHSVGWLAYCKDPEGNLFGMLQPDPSAK